MLSAQNNKRDHPVGYFLLEGSLIVLYDHKTPNGYLNIGKQLWNKVKPDIISDLFRFASLDIITTNLRMQPIIKTSKFPLILHF